jgi:dinuclear metal center YbgI/SA1388 family protein
MKITEFVNLLEKYAPLKLSSDFVKEINGYDNSGVIVNLDKDITGVVFSLDLTDIAVDMAIKNGCNLIFTHHPAIYAPINKIDYNSPIYKAINNGIGVVSFHLNLDCAINGIDYYLAKGLGANNQEIMISLGEKVGYGRVFDVKKQSFNCFVESFKLEFNSNKVLAYGNLNDEISSVASFCGSGLDEEVIDKASSVDVLVSSDVKHHLIIKALSQGKKLMVITHYSSEFYGFKRFYENVKDEIGVKTLLNIEQDYL